MKMNNGKFLLSKVNEIIINAKNNNMKTININLDNNILDKIKELQEYINLSKDISKAEKDRILKRIDELEQVCIDDLLKKELNNG